MTSDQLAPQQLAMARDIVAAGRQSGVGVDEALQGTIVHPGPVHMTAEDYHRATSSATGGELVPVQRSNQLATLPAIPAGAQVIVIQAPAAPAAEPAGGKWTPGNVLALAVVAVVGIVALVLLAPMILAAVQSLMLGAIVLGAVGVLLVRALRPTPAPAAPTKRRGRGRRR